MTTDDRCTSCFNAVADKPALLSSRDWEIADDGHSHWITSGRPAIAACGKVFV